MKAHFLGASAKLRNVTIKLHHVRLSALNNSAPAEQKFVKFGIEYFSKIWRENSSFIKIWEEKRVL